MPLDKMNMFWNQHAMSQQNKFFQPPASPGQFRGSNYTQMLGQSLQGFPTTTGGQGGLPMQSEPGRSIDGFGGGLGGEMPRPQGNPGWNPTWGARQQNAGAQGYATPGYPPQGIGQQQPQRPMPPSQGFLSQGYPTQGYPLQSYGTQWYNQGYGGQMPVQPAWDEPKKSGIKGFITNLMAKRKG